MRMHWWQGIVCCCRRDGPRTPERAIGPWRGSAVAPLARAFAAAAALHCAGSCETLAFSSSDVARRMATQPVRSKGGARTRGARTVLRLGFSSKPSESSSPWRDGISKGRRDGSGHPGECVCAYMYLGHIQNVNTHTREQAARQRTDSQSQSQSQRTRVAPPVGSTAASTAP